jgi:hypothetical protein
VHKATPKYPCSNLVGFVYPIVCNKNKTATNFDKKSRDLRSLTTRTTIPTANKLDS